MCVRRLHIEVLHLNERPLRTAHHSALLLGTSFWFVACAAQSPTGPATGTPASTDAPDVATVAVSSSASGATSSAEVPPPVLEGRSIAYSGKLKPTDVQVGSLSVVIALPDGLKKDDARKGSVVFRRGEIDEDGLRVDLFDSMALDTTLEGIVETDRIQLKGATGEAIGGAFVVRSPTRASVRVHRIVGNRQLECWAGYVTDKKLDRRDAVMADLEQLCLSARVK
ncbi:MAG: hypothetical protein U0414_29625 [Polyangiaceae bacterium]